MHRTATPRNMSVPNARGAVPKQVQGHNTPHPTRPTLPTHTLPQLVTTTPSHNVTNNGTPRNRNGCHLSKLCEGNCSHSHWRFLPRATVTATTGRGRLRHCPRQGSPCFNYHKSLLVCNRSLSHTSAPHPRSSTGYKNYETWISWSQFKLTCHSLPEYIFKTHPLRAKTLGKSVLIKKRTFDQIRGALLIKFGI